MSPAPPVRAARAAPRTASSLPSRARRSRLKSRPTALTWRRRARAAPPGAVAMRPSLLLAVGLVAASSLSALADDGGTRVGAAAYGDWRCDAPGVHRKLTAADLPPPGASRSAANPSWVAASRRRRLPNAPPVSPSACSPAASSSRASCASRRTATSSSPKAAPGASASSRAADGARKAAQTDRLRRRAASAVRDRLLSGGAGPAVRLRRRDRPRRALPLSQRRS